MARLNHHIYSFAAREDYETKLYEIQKMLKAKNRSEALRGATDLAHAMQPLIHDDGAST
jgi:hypothetical protein